LILLAKHANSWQHGGWQNAICGEVVMHVPNHLINEVMALPADTRAELAAILQQSLPIKDVPGMPASDEELTNAWTEELNRRIVKFRNGESRGVDAHTAFAAIRQQLDSDQGPSGA
jgi:Putative addiction module component